jgi:dTMP kinase
MAYQGFGMGQDVGAIAALIRLLGLIPDISLFLEVSENLAKERLAARGTKADRYDLMGADMRARIAHGFLSIAAAEPERCVIIDAAQDADAVTQNILAVLRARLSLG